MAESTFDVIIERIQNLEEGNMKFPKNYSAENAARAAWLTLQETTTKDGKPVLQVCSKQSIANAVLKMITQGLNTQKDQGSFVAYGSKLIFQREYQGSILLAKRQGMKDIKAVVIYQGDKFAFKLDPTEGKKHVTQHDQTLESLDGEIKGAYAVVKMNDGSTYAEIMTINDIRKSWQQGAAKGNSPAHKNFAGEMCKKTVINRACKGIINSSDDSDLYEEDIPEETVSEAHLNHQKETKANKQSLDFNDVEDAEHEEVQPKQIAEKKLSDEEMQKLHDQAIEEETKKQPNF
jgi:recombination protein RecT